MNNGGSIATSYLMFLSHYALSKSKSLDKCIFFFSSSNFLPLSSFVKASLSVILKSLINVDSALQNQLYNVVL